MSVNLTHRYANYDAAKPDFLALYDDVTLALDRANAMLHLLQTYFVINDDVLPVNNSVMSVGMSSVLMELEDMEKMLKHFADHEIEQA